MAAEKKDPRNSRSAGRNNQTRSGANNPTAADDTHLLIGDDAVTPEIKKYQAMLETNPASRVFASLAELYRKQGMLDEAISLCLKGLKAHPAYVSGRVVLGRAYFDKGLVREAAQELEKVVEVNPDHLMANKVLGDVSLMSGDIEKARYYFERVLTLAPEDIEVKKKLEPIRTEGGPANGGPEEVSEERSDETGSPDEIIEGESLQIVDHGRGPTDIPHAQIIPDDREVPTEYGEIDLTGDEISEILMRTEEQIHDIKSKDSVDTHTIAERASPSPSVVGRTPESPDGLYPLYGAIERIQIGITITDLDGKIHYANPAAARMHGRETNELVGGRLTDFFPPGILQSMTMSEILEKKSIARDTVNVRKDGTVFPVRMTYDIVENEKNEPTYIIIGIDDLTKHKDVDESLWQYAVKDVQTGLFNRRHFVTKIREEIKRAERMAYPLCLLVFSIKDFGSYQKLRGEKKAGKTLAEIGRIAHASIRKEVDSAFRFGEDEFALILPTATEEKAVIVAARLVEKVKRKLPDIEIRIGTASRADHPSIEEMVSAAEKAMYR